MRSPFPPRQILTLSMRGFARGPAFAFARACYAGVLFLPAAFGSMVPMTGVEDREVLGHGLFLLQAALSLLAVTLVAPALVVQTLGEEARAGRLSLLVIAGRDAHGIVEGFMVGELFPIVSVIAAGVPITMVAFLLGGVSPTEVVVALAATLILALLAGSVGAFVGLAGGRAAAGMAVAASFSVALLVGNATWGLMGLVGGWAYPLMAFACLVASRSLVRAASRRLDVVALGRAQGTSDRRALEESPSLWPQSRSIPELWPLVDPGVGLMEHAWLMPGLSLSVLGCLSAIVVRTVMGPDDADFFENLLASVGAVGLVTGMMLATWYPALRIASLVEPSSLACIATTPQDALRVLWQMERSMAGIAGGVLSGAMLLLLPAALRGSDAASLASTLVVTGALFACILEAAMLIGVDAPSPRRALGSATLLLGLAIAVVGPLWSRLLLGRGVAAADTLMVAGALLFVGSLARSQARHMFRGRWREPLGDLLRLRVW